MRSASSESSGGDVERLLEERDGLAVAAERPGAFRGGARAIRACAASAAASAGSVEALKAAR